MAYFWMLLLRDMGRSRIMWWVGSRGLHGGKGKCIQVSGKKNMKERENFEDLSIDRMNTVSSANTCDLVMQIGYNMIESHGMKWTTCLQLVLRLQKNVTTPLLPLCLHIDQKKIYLLSLKHVYL